MRVGDFGGEGGEGILDVWMGAGGGEVGAFDGGGVVITMCDEVGVAKVRFVSSLMGDEIVSGEDSDDELR